jgi:HEPN domain-containing protein
MRLEEDASSPQAWLARAKSNFYLAESGQDIKGVYFEDLCFEAQQAAEKSLKAVCIHLNLDFPKTHSLSSLLEIIGEANILVPEELYQAVILTQYAVRTRYPGVAEPITKEEYLAAISFAKRIVAWAEAEISN